MGGVEKVERIAAIDCGTNSIRLLIAEPSVVPASSAPDSKTPAGDDRATGTLAGATAGSIRLVDLDREMRIVRLGQGVDATGYLTDEAIERTLAAVREYAALLAERQVTDARFVATSAMRDAQNGGELVSQVQETLGITPEVIPGTEEARLSFQGATGSLPLPAAEMKLVVDIGGGSTEFVLGGETVEQSVSMDMGSVRVMERFGIVPGNDQGIAAATEWIDAKLDEAESIVDFSRVDAIVGVAGTVTTLAAHLAGVDAYDPAVTHGRLFPLQEWHAGAAFMIEQPTEVKAALGFMPPGRADVIGAGALIWSRILHRVAQRSPQLAAAYVSEHDILDGIALSLAADTFARSSAQ